MSEKESCPLCGGRRVILDPDPMLPARTCPQCAAPRARQRNLQGVPSRYKECSLDGFWDWWKIQHPKERISQVLAGAYQLLEHEETRLTLSEDIRSKLDLIVHKCGPKPLGDGDLGWKDVKTAQEPSGYRSLYNWARSDRDPSDFWWIDGPPGSGRSALAAAVLRAWCERTEQTGLFVSVRTLSQELKDLYYDTRSFRNVDFLSERDRMAPMLAAPCLVLDDFDRMDGDIRVVRAFAQLLDHRYSEQLPTLLVAGRWAESLQMAGPESYPLLRLEDASLFRRLASSKRTVLRPTIERLMESVNG